ncbi:hypothetical protein J2W24_003640 [Variovorax boronicumulans]|uniref:hypothetical protein n=1 Tax=Variovorax boronicumulans TaxID=436515 RepID=UPI0027846FBA|nr:hypothetical protein [Variovorax boronicumulans]MDP9917984.1 hypothetical protein [Variovorax boronicumulans]
MTEWQFIESGLVQLFEHAIRGGHHAGVAAAFHVPQGFRIRLDMCTAAVSKSGAPAPWIARWKEISLKLKKLGDKRNITSHGITMFDATRPAGERLFMTTNLNHPDKRQDVFSHAVGVSVRNLHEQALEYSAAYDELAAFSNYFSVAIKDRFPEGDRIPGPALGQWPETPGA